MTRKRQVVDIKREVTELPKRSVRDISSVLADNRVSGGSGGGDGGGGDGGGGDGRAGKRRPLKK